MMNATTEKKVTVKNNGFTFEGMFLASRTQFLFDVWEVIVDVSGERFESISEANRKLDADIDQKAIAVEAGNQAGWDAVDLAELDNVTDS